MIKVKDYISHGITRAEGIKIAKLMVLEYQKTKQIHIDFSKVFAFTSHFFSETLLNWYYSLGREQYEQVVHVYNLSKSGQETFNECIKMLEIKK